MRGDELQGASFNAVAYRASGGWCLVALDADGQILASSAVGCVWSGTPRFHEWFLGRWDIAAVVPLARRAAA